MKATEFDFENASRGLDLNSKCKRVNITTNEGVKKRHSIIGVCEDGVLITEFETKVGMCISETELSEIQDIVYETIYESDYETDDEREYERKLNEIRKMK
ncbi:MAG TPA: hypothetical protein VIK55_14085 [Paludibacter sp.]